MGLIALMFIVDLIAPVISPILGPTAILAALAFLIYSIIKSVKS
jgi:sorbitol-specific phosphotransferase system component IIBC